MFVVLQIDGRGRYGKTGLRILDRLRGGRLTSESKQVAGGSYQIVRWSGIGMPDWELIESACRRTFNRVLLPQGVHVPDGIRITAPALPRFERRVLCETACEIAKRSGLALYRRVLGLVDPSGELSGLLPGLLRYYSLVKVVTGNLDLYEKESRRMMDELGAPVIVGCDPESLGDCLLVLTCGSGYLQAKKLDVPVLCPDGFPGGNPCITSPQITPSREIIDACPPDISLQSFAGALFEHCGVVDMNLTATAMLCDYRQSSLVEVVRVVSESALRAGGR